MQLGLLEYEKALRETPSGAFHPIPPQAPKGRRICLREIERIGTHLGRAWRSDANIRENLIDVPENADAYGRSHRADLWIEYVKLARLPGSLAAIEWAERVRCDDDMIWVHMPGEKNWELVYIEGYPGQSGRFCARSIVTEDVLYELQEDGNSLHGNIPKTADCSIPWSTFKLNKKASWEKAATEIMDQWAKREGFSILEHNKYDFTEE